MPPNALLQCISKNGSPEDCQKLIDNSKASKRRLSWTTTRRGHIEECPLTRAVWYGNHAVVDHIVLQGIPTGTPLADAFRGCQERYSEFYRLFSCDDDQLTGAARKRLLADFKDTPKYAYRAAQALVDDWGLEVVPIFLEADRVQTLTICYRLAPYYSELSDYANMHVKETTWRHRSPFLLPVLQHRRRLECDSAYSGASSLDALSLDVIKTIARYLFSFPADDEDDVSSTTTSDQCYSECDPTETFTQYKRLRPCVTRTFVSPTSSYGDTP
ncbi:hypothetical protein DIPPA_28292 [Diplonema papillatum]|nr:hypothetical protein DIPPA_28292 [Diplonema papillatum]|eukprot:gene20818-32094_t